MPATMSDRPKDWQPADEARFQSWYANAIQGRDLDPNPDAPDHHYNYRMAFKAGVWPNDAGHWPSEFKDASHPNRYVDGQDTTSGQPQTLAQRIKAKYPGQYDDLADSELEAKIVAKYPGAYDDLPRTQSAAVMVKGQPVSIDDYNQDPTQQTRQSTWTDTAIDWLPAVGGAVGGLAGNVPGAIVGGMVGQRLKHYGEAYRGERPLPALGTAMKEVALQGGVQGASEGAGQLIGKAMSAVAPRLMQSALKPGVKALARDMRAGAPVPKVVQTLLDEGINVSPGGVAKLQDILETTNAGIEKAVANSPARIDPRTVAARVLPTAQKFSEQVDPLKDLTAIGETVERFLDHPTLGSSGLSVREAQQLKVGTYRMLKKKYGQIGAASVETEKALARGLKEEIATAVPDVSALNAREGRILEALDAVGRRAALNNNRDPVGFAWAAHEPSKFIAALIDRNPVVKSLIARGLYSAAGTAARVSPQAIRAAVVSLSSDDPDAGFEAATSPGPTSPRP